MTGNIDKAVKSESDAANHCGSAHTAPRAGSKRQTAPDPDNQSQNNKQRDKPAHLNRQPQPITLRMNGFTWRDEEAAMRGKERPKIAQTGAEHGRRFEELKRIALD